MKPEPQEKTQDAQPGLLHPVVVPSDTYDPIKCLREEVERFKATNLFSPMLVTNFYAQAAVVLTYTAELEEELRQMIARAEYVCVGTKIVAISDLQGQLNHAKRVIRWPCNVPMQSTSPRNGSSKPAARKNG